MVGAVGDARQFKSGRELAAWLGLVPAHRKSGNREVTLGISKRGDRYLRTLLIHGARAVVSVAEQRRDASSVWVSRIKQRQHGGTNIAAVALANKNARVLWALLSRNDRPFDAGARMMMAWRSFLENLLGSYKVRHPRWPQISRTFVRFLARA